VIVGAVVCIVGMFVGASVGDPVGVAVVGEIDGVAVEGDEDGEIDGPEVTGA
jgi:hypothetical protein